MKLLLSLIAAFILMSCQTSRKVSSEKIGIVSGTEWRDTENKRINAHGGGLLYHKGTYYWYGECKSDSTYWNPNVPGWECYRTEAGGINCYSSKDLLHWKYEGVVLKPVTSNTESDLHPSKVLERPKVIYNDKTKKFVMWLHVDSDDYSKAAAGVAVSDSPAGTFEYLGSMHPNEQISRDMTLFKDDDGKAYHIYSSEQNATLYISLLSDDYLKPSGTFTRNFAGKFREAPAIFKRNHLYYLISSGCSGWSPNEAEYAVAEQIMGPWTVKGNPCIGKDADKTFYGQSTYVLSIQGKKDAYIAMFDKWNKTDLINSTYIWLPIRFQENGDITIGWLDNWSPKTFWSETK